MPLFSSPCWNVNIRPESHLVSTIKIDGRNVILGLKRLHSKELTSWPVGLCFQGLDALSLSLLKKAGTTADKVWRGINL